MTNEKVIYVDMDGVLCNFMLAFAIHYNREDLVDRIIDRSYPGDWLMEGEFGSDEREVWKLIHDLPPRVWANLTPYDWTWDLLDLLDDIKASEGIDWFICTHASKSQYAHSGKLQWIKKFLGEDFNRIIMIGHKHLLARPGTLLIDDHEKTCEDFRNAGGKALLFPQPWNSNKEKIHDEMQCVSFAIDETFSEILV